MSVQSHVIRCLHVQIHTNKNKDSHSVQSQIYKIIQLQILPILTEFFSKSVPADVVMHVNRITLDLGTVNLFKIEQDVVNNLHRCLPLLQKTISQGTHVNVSAIIPLLEAKLQAIEYYLSEGNFAWWMAQNSEKQIQQLYEELVHTNPLCIEQLWYRLDKKEKAVQRFITQFDMSIIESTLCLLLKQPDAPSMLKEAAILLNKVGYIAHGPYSPQRQLFAAALLGVIHQKHVISSKIEFLAMLLKQVASQKAISYPQLLDKLYPCCQAYKRDKNVSATTNDFLLHLHDLALIQPHIARKALYKPTACLHVLDRIKNHNMSFEQLSEAMHALELAIDHPNISSLVKSWLTEQNNRAQLAKKLPDTLFMPFIQAIEPTIYPVYMDFIELLSHFIKQLPVELLLKIRVTTLACYAFGKTKAHYLNDLSTLLYAYFPSITSQARSNRLLNPKHCSLGVKKLFTTLVSSCGLIHHPNTLVTVRPLLVDRLTALAYHIGDNLRAKILMEHVLMETLAMLPLFSGMGKYSVSGPTHAQEPLWFWLKKKIANCLNKQVVKQALQHIALQDNINHRKASITRLLQSLLEDIWSSSVKQKQSIRLIRSKKFMPLALTCIPHRCQSFKPMYAFQQRDKYLWNVLQRKMPYDHNYVNGDRHLYALNQDESMGQDIFSLDHVIDFLVNDQLPESQQVPAYFLAKSLALFDDKSIVEHLGPLFQEKTILKKCILYATEPVLAKLVQAFVPFSSILSELERVIIHAKVLKSTESQTQIRFIKEIFIQAAVIQPLPKTERQYIERIILCLSSYALANASDLCKQLAHSATKLQFGVLEDIFSSCQKQLAPLGLEKLDEIDLLLLPIHELLNHHLDENNLSLYYHHFLPAVKGLIQKDYKAQVLSKKLRPLIKQYLPKLLPLWQNKICVELMHILTKAIQYKKQHMLYRWGTFLHTGLLGNYKNATALFQDMIAHNCTFNLEKVVQKAYVRQRLIMHFTQQQHMLLLQKNSIVGGKFVQSVQELYNLWCNMQGVVGDQADAQHLFWDAVYRNLLYSSTAFNVVSWTEQLFINLSASLHIAPIILLQSFQLLSRQFPIKNQNLIMAFDALQEKFHQEVQHKISQSNIENNLLKKLYYLLNSGLYFFSNNYGLSIQALEKELITLLKQDANLLYTMLRNQPNNVLVTRRLVYYFKEAFIIKLILLLAQSKHDFVQNYLNFCVRLAQQKMDTLGLEFYKKELLVAILNYLLNAPTIDSKQLVQQTFGEGMHDKAMILQMRSSMSAIEPIHKDESKIVEWLKHSPSDWKQMESVRQDPLELVKTPRKREAAVMLEREVRIYTKNTGLVFLWPFLYDFFKDINLVAGSRFVCNQAAHNAVYILQYLVTGAFTSAEWALTLPKLLCGLAYDDVLMPYSSLEEVLDDGNNTQDTTCCDSPIPSSSVIPAIEVERIGMHSNIMMQKVIKRWKTLAKMKKIDQYQHMDLVDIVKSFFLNRIGILMQRKVEGYATCWNLTMIHQEYDAYDLLPPWSMSKVKLPWMQQELFLFWMYGE